MKLRIIFLLFISLSYVSATNLVIASGSKNGMYYQTAQILAKYASMQGLNVNVLETKGTLHNLSLAKHSNIPILLGQPDVVDVFVSKNKVAIEEVGNLHTEYVHIICNDESDIKSINDLESVSSTLAIGEKGSSNYFTWKNFTKVDNDYEKAQVLYIDFASSFQALKNNILQCIMYTAGTSTATMQYIDQNADGLHIINVNDWDFNDVKDSNGETLYEFTKIPKNTYKNLQAGFWGSKAIKTIGIKAKLYVNNNVPTHIKEKIKTAYVLAQKEIQNLGH